MGELEIYYYKFINTKLDESTILVCNEKIKSTRQKLNIWKRDIEIGRIEKEGERKNR